KTGHRGAWYARSSGWAAGSSAPGSTRTSAGGRAALAARDLAEAAAPRRGVSRWRPALAGDMQGMQRSEAAMSYKDFTVQDLVQKLGLSMTERSLFADASEQPPSAWLVETLKETAPLGLSIGNEKARSELLITPVLVEVRRSLSHRVSLF